MQLNKSQAIIVEKERINKQRHFEMLKEFEYKEKTQALKLEQLYVLDEIKTARESEADLISLNQLYTQNSEYFHHAYELKQLTNQSKELQTDFQNKMKQLEPSPLNAKQ